ncbi:E3 SUMO-protein ligase NSE2 isoform X1 [Denticeps clupeoides]|uniref:E3 SUMO-protein ligase NSE2 n=1 Tax=Denticeps clupeoides TaxID=299321 RepID=A0AAY4BYA2_9TELE|nr:E3 SUMO-protein ligase NSE2 isoform X1 [Denticeps clupeoides]
MSMSTVQSTLSTLKTCQGDINTAMDIVTEVALDLVEAQGRDDDQNKLQGMMMECAKLDSDMTCFMEAVQTVTAQVTQDPDVILSLKSSFQTEFEALKSRVSDLNSHTKVVAFKNSVKKILDQEKQSEGGDDEEQDEEITVTQSQPNYTCPLTQVEMVNPVKNRKCQHHYDESAVLAMIQRQQKNHKKFRCPVVGCGNQDVNPEDLLPDPILKRKIQAHKRQNSKT